MEGLTLGVTDGSLETVEKSSFVDFLKEIFCLEFEQRHGGLVNRSQCWVFGGILMRCFVSRRVTVYVPTRFIPLHIVTRITHVEFLLPWNYLALLYSFILQGLCDFYLV